MDSILANGYYFWGGLAAVMMLAEALGISSMALVFSLASLTVFVVLTVFGAPGAYFMQLLMFVLASTLLYFLVNSLRHREESLPHGEVSCLDNASLLGVVKVTAPGGRGGEVVLDRPLHGEMRWMFIADTALQAGDRVWVAEINETMLKVSAAG